MLRKVLFLCLLASNIATASENVALLVKNSLAYKVIINNTDTSLTSTIKPLEEKIITDIFKHDSIIDESNGCLVPTEYTLPYKLIVKDQDGNNICRIKIDSSRAILQLHQDASRNIFCDYSNYQY